MDKKFFYKLDKEREIKFTGSAVVALDQKFGINLLRPTAYQEFPPAKVAALLWAGQMHTPKALRPEQVEAYVPVSTKAFYELVLVLSEAIGHALQDPEDTDSK